MFRSLQKRQADAEEVHLSLLPEKDLRAIEGLLAHCRKTLQHQTFEWRDALLQFKETHGHLTFICELLISNVRPQPFLTAFRYVRALGASVGVAEYPYLDLEHWQAYSLIHSRSFPETAKRGCRLHFFQTNNVDPTGLLDLLILGADQQAVEESGFTYLGFVVFRPIPSFNIGRTALRSFPERSAAFGYQKGVVPFTSTIAGTRLSLQAVPFIQQDPAAGVCSTASLWVASQILSAKFGMNKHAYPEISRIATHDSSQAIPLDFVNNQTFDDGLTIPEITTAMRREGAAPRVLIPQAEAPLGKRPDYVRLLLHLFSDSELPVILVLKRPRETCSHAVTLVGHGSPVWSESMTVEACSMKSILNASPSDRHLLLSQAITSFLVHDDRYGPFRKLRLGFLPGETKPEGMHLCPVRLGDDEEGDWYDLKALIVPFPPYVRNTPTLIVNDIWIRFSRYFHNETALKGFTDPRILWRGFLVLCSSLKKSFVQRGFPEQLLRKYNTLHLPKYVWYFEMTVAEAASVPTQVQSVSDRRIQGEFLYDSTTPPYVVSPLVQRFNSYLVTDPALVQREKADVELGVKNSLLDPPIDGSFPCFTGSPHA